MFPHGTGDPVSWNFDIADPDGNDDLAYTDAVMAELSASNSASTRAASTRRGCRSGPCSPRRCCAPRRRDRGRGSGCRPAGPRRLRSLPPRSGGHVSRHGGSDPSVQRWDRPVGHPRRRWWSDHHGPSSDLDGEGYPAAVAAFAGRNDCDPEPTDTDLTEAVLHGSTTVRQGQTSSS